MKINREIRNVLLNRFLISLGILLFIRLGTFLPVPGINHSDLAFYIQRHSVAKNLISTFTGDNIFVIGLFTLNIFPYINATIFIQLLLGFSPKLAKLQKEGDFEGRRSISRLTRLLTLIWAIIQSIGISLYLRQVLFDWNIILAGQIVLWLTTGAMIVLWLSELITDFGLGNGASLLIYTNITSNLPNLLKKITIENATFFAFVEIILLITISFYGMIFLQKATRRIPLLSSKQLNQPISSSQDAVNSYLPLRFNQAGVMPIILTTTILVVPNYLINLGIFQWLSALTVLKSVSWIYWIGYFFLVLAFSSFYSSIVLNPKDMSDQLQKMAVTIPGVRPGLQTTFYLKSVIKRITLVGATMLAILTVVPNFLESTLNVTGLNGLSSTSFLIVAGVILDLMREIENIFVSNAYNNRYQ